MKLTPLKSAICGALLALGMQAGLSHAESMDEEIDYLIGAVGSDGCTFVRNGERFSARAARAHLRSKRRRNAHLIHSTEEFVQKIASQSATTRKPYLFSCRGEGERSANEWFSALLQQRRDS